MDEPEPKVQSFIVKLWLQEVGDETGRAAWRGYITHVPGGERRYVKRLSDIEDFIACYLKKIGIEPGPHFRVKGWLRRLKLWLGRRF